MQVKNLLTLIGRFTLLVCVFFFFLVFSVEQRGVVNGHN